MNVTTSAESLYQWDVGQILRINGLSLTVAPKVHFATKVDDTAYVVQSEMNGGTITVGIPDKVLTHGYPIIAYVYLEQGTDKRTIKSITIPVIKRAKPSTWKETNAESIIEAVNLYEQLTEEMQEMRDLLEALDASGGGIVGHMTNTNNPHGVTATQVGAVSLVSLVGIGLNSSNFSDTDIFENLKQIYEAMPNYSEFKGYGLNTSLTKSIVAKLNEDLGMSLGSVTVILHIMKYSNNAPMRVDVMYDYTGYGGSDRVFTCIFNTDSNNNHTLTKFAQSFNPSGFLPLTGGTLTGELSIKNGNGSLEASSSYLVMRSKVDDNNNRRLIVYNHTNGPSGVLEKAVQLANTIDGNSKPYILYGAHNITAGTTDLTAGTSALTTDCYYDVYK